MALSASELLHRVIAAVRSSGWAPLVVSDRKPFEITSFKDDEDAVDLVVYIWNCTHGGGAARANDEFRIQFTGTVPRHHRGAVTLLLGWYEELEVFAAWDVRRHDGQASRSPSAQIKQAALQQAVRQEFGLYTKLSGEVAIAFRPELFMVYALSASKLHQSGKAAADFAVLDDIDRATDAAVAAIANVERRLIISQIVRKFRAADFSKRVLGAYRNRCAMCDVQLQIIDAAHIVPVAAQGSTDETKNGVALCKLHHAAYDRNLVSFNQTLDIEVSEFELARLRDLDLHHGIQGFRRSLRPQLLTPVRVVDRPCPKLIALSRQLRNWR